MCTIGVFEVCVIQMIFMMYILPEWGRLQVLDLVDMQGKPQWACQAYGSLSGTAQATHRVELVSNPSTASMDEPTQVRNPHTSSLCLCVCVCVCVCVPAFK